MNHPGNHNRNETKPHMKSVSMKTITMQTKPFLSAMILAIACCGQGMAHDYFVIKVVDEETGRGVPLIELQTVNNIRLYTDSAGIVAFNEPGLMDQSVYFHISGHGYEYPKDGFGFRGKRLSPRAGESVTLKIKRVNIAQRLYRVTGAGIYRDSILAGQSVSTQRPVLNGQVLGSDSVVNAVYKGKIHWFWGDTNQPSYPLGNFHVPGAVSRLPRDGGLDPEQGVDLEYFVDETGFAKPMAKMPGPGPTWITGLVAWGDEPVDQQMFAAYVKIAPPLKVYERGLAKYNDDKNEFEKLVEFDLDAPLYPNGHPFEHGDQTGRYIYFGDPFPTVRVHSSPQAIQDLSQYETYTCLRQGSRQDSIEIERENGKPKFSWKTDTIPYTPELQTRLIRQGHLEPESALFQLTDDDGKFVEMHRGSVRWNEYRQRWIMIATQINGSSLLGEVWYAEAEDLVGPWRGARKIASHDKYSFYNPKQHAMLDKEGGREIFFEGTYTHTFSGNPDQTPRYDYNQIMYKLDLSDPRLH